MTRTRRALLELGRPTMLVEIAEARGSTPREAGAWMLVSIEDVAGTIGGGQVEYMAIDHARQALRRGTRRERLDIPLGPEIGQCCGGRMILALTALDAALVAELRLRLVAARARLPHVLIFGAGHVGRALAVALGPLPVRAVLIDQRAGELALACDVETRLSALSEAEVALAPAGAAYVVLTHDHALDFLIASAALERTDAAYVGLIGSATKRARFAAFRRDEGRDLTGLTCPIGGATGDKRPSVIAALTAAELMTRLGAPCGVPPRSDLHRPGRSART